MDEGGDPAAHLLPPLCAPEAVLHLLHAPLVVPEHRVQLALATGHLGVAEAGREELEHELGGDLGGHPTYQPRHPGAVTTDLVGGGVTVRSDTQTPTQGRCQLTQDSGQQKTEDRVSHLSRRPTDL